MDALAMLAPSERSVRGKLQLFLRLWVARQKYEQLRPFGETTAQKVRFHLDQLLACWNHVLEFQRALGLEVMHFSPREKFELIYVITAFADREINHPSNTILDIRARWAAYQFALSKLSYGLNPYDFCDGCSRCYKLLLDLFLPPAEDAEVIPMPAPHVNHLNPHRDPELRMKEHDHSDSGASRYSPGGRFSYSRK
jgi:hypothetical protein